VTKGSARAGVLTLCHSACCGTPRQLAVKPIATPCVYFGLNRYVTDTDVYEMSWWPLLLGWPAIALSAWLAATGFVRRSEYWLLAAIVPIMPLGLYIFGSPLYWWLPVLVLFFLLASSWHIRRKRRSAA
jgi:hypothetical protein